MKHILITTIAAVVLLATTAFAGPIHTAAKKGDLARVQKELDKGTDVNAKNNNGDTPLLRALLFGHEEVAALLIAAGADVNAKDKYGKTPLYLAIENKQTEIADIIRKHGGKTGDWLNADKSIHIATRAGHIEAVKQHLAAGVDANAKDEWGWTPLHEAATKDVAELLIAEGADVNAKDDEGWTPLHEAAWEGRKEVVELLIAAGADVNAKDELEGVTPLHYVTYYGRKEVVELLIAKGADVNAKDWEGNTPLDMVMMSGEPEIADILREHGGKTSDWFSDWNKAEESIHIAVRVGHIEAVKQHLAAGTDVNAKDGEWGYTLLHSAVDKGHKEVAELLIANGADVNAKWGEWDQWTPLHFATTKGIAELLIAKGADVNAKSFRGYTPLHQAAYGGHKETVELLIAAGADLNAKADFMEFTPLYRVARLGHKEIAELLIAAGADVNAQTVSGWTPLHYATTKEIAEMLIADGANVNAKAVDRSTPLHFAARSGQKKVVELLITKGAGVNAKANDGKTPLNWAIGSDETEIADLLRKHGGKTSEELKALMPRLVQHGRFAFSFDAKEGKVYEVQDSFDLLNWEVIKTYTGTGASFSLMKRGTTIPRNGSIV